MPSIRLDAMLHGWCRWCSANTKLDLPAGEDDDRRILAVLAYVRPELYGR